MCVCTNDTPHNRVIGTDRYSERSDICWSARHAGLGLEGEVTVYAYPECDMFVGTHRDGSTSRHDENAGPSFGFVEQPRACRSLLDVELVPAPPPADATCDNTHALNEICKRAQDGSDAPQWFTYVAEAPYDCPCGDIQTSGLDLFLPRAYRKPAKVESVSGVTPLQAAVSLAHEREVRFLLEHGADPDAGSARPLQLAIELTDRPKRTRIAAMLVQAGAGLEGLDLSTCAPGGRPPLDCESLAARLR
jgi:hypothetical protein